MKRIVQVIVIFILTITMSMEVGMATKANNQIKSKPVGMGAGGGGMKNNNQLVQRPDNYKPNNTMDQQEPDFGQAGAGSVPELPAWMQVMIGLAKGGAQELLPPSKNNNRLANRRNDRLAPHLNYKNFNQLAPHLQDGGGGSPFASSYGGGGGWGRGSGGGWDGGGGYSDSPAWLNNYLRLNNWNIG